MGKPIIAVYGDTPTVSTGFGRVVRDIFTHLTDEFEVKIFGINYNGYPHSMPFEVFPAALPTSAGPYDPYGRQHLVQWLERQRFDIFFMINDAWLLQSFAPEILQGMRRKHGSVPTVCYFPIDVEETEPNYYTWLKDEVTVPVTYTEFGRKVVGGLVPDIAGRMLVIPHGADPDAFHPIAKSDPLVQKAKAMAGGKFNFINVNRNQVRKNIPGCLRAMRLYTDMPGCEEDNIVLHMMETDNIGCNIPGLANGLGFKRKAVIRLSAAQVSDMELNLILNGCDASVTTSIGDGWGLSMSEAIAAGIPAIAPAHTSFPEVLLDFGHLYKPGIQHCALQNAVDRSNWRWYCDPAEVAGAMYHVRTNYEEYKQRALAGREWYMNNRTWKDHVAPLWRRLFRQLLSR